MKALIVDDEYAKAQKIAAAIAAATPSAEVVHVSTAHAARLELRAKKFELLLIDLNLPDVLGAAPTIQGGIQLFDMVLMDDQIHMPSEIAFISAKDDAVVEAQSQCIKRGVSLIQFRPSDDSWTDAVTGRCILAERRSTTASRVRPMDVAIVTALRSPELEAILALPYGWKRRKIDNDPTNYHFGSLRTSQGEISVVAATAQRKGMPSAAAISSRMSLLFQPKLLIMPGICAGVEGKVNMGDVVVADPTWDWGSGKQVEGLDNSIVFKAAAHQRPLKTSMAEHVVELIADSEVTARIRGGWTGPVPAGAFKVHVGPMASGASVVAHSKIIESIIEKQRDVLAIEMEAYAVMAAAEYSGEPVPLAMAIKSVCDFGNSDKGDSWQKYAAYTSAAFVDELIRSDIAVFLQK